MTAAAMNLESRIAELEVKMAFQDDLLGTLNDTVAELSGALLSMGRDLAVVRRELEAQRLAQGQDAGIEPPPPHY